MAHSNGKIYTTENSGVSITDIASTLGVSDRDLGTLCQRSNINSCSKVKPVRSSEKASLDDTARKALRYGFGSTVPLVGNLATVWSYSKPRGKAYNEWFRMQDFNGYFHNAPVPLKVEATVTKGSDVYTMGYGTVVVMLSFDESVNSLWDSDTCMSFKDFLDSGNPLWSGYSFAFLIRNVTKSIDSFVVTDKTLAERFPNETLYSTPFLFYQENMFADGKCNPEIPALADADLGDEFLIVACLVVNENMWITDNYQNNYNVYTSETSPTASRYESAYSLAFKEGCDRATANCESMWSINQAFAVDGTLTFNASDSGEIVTMKQDGQLLNQLEGHKFVPSASVTINTQNCPSWAAGSAQGLLSVTLVLRIYTPSASSSGCVYSMDGDIKHYSCDYLYPGGGYQLVEWRKPLGLRNQSVVNYTLDPFISPNKENPLDPQLPLTTPDDIYVLWAHGSPSSSVTCYFQASIVYGSEEVDLGSSNTITLTF